MADYKHFRILLDLGAYFHDHRRIARIFIKKNIGRIADLQNRISEIFEIGDFYLTTGDHFLPASEDVRVLSNNESVCVRPCKPHEVARPSILTVTSSSKKEHKKHKRPLEPVLEDSDETSTGKKKKGKKKHIDVTPISSCSSNDDVPRKKKKSETNESVVLERALRTKIKQKKVNHNSENLPIENSYENEVSHKTNQNQGIVERQICNIESSQKIIDIKKKFRHKADEYIKKHSSNVAVDSNIKNVLPKLQSHLKNCNDLGRSNLPDAVRLSRHVDTPLKTFSRYSAPSRITASYLAKNKVNIVKIDVVENPSKQIIEQPNVSQSTTNGEISVGTLNENIEGFTTIHHSSDESFYTPPKNYVKEVINTFEKNISPELNKQVKEQDNNVFSKKVEIPDNEASNYTKEFLDQREPCSLDSFETKTDIAVNLIKNSVDVVPVSNNIVNDLENQKTSSETQIINTEDLLTTRSLSEEMEPTNVSLDTSSIDVDTYYLSSSLNSTNTSLNNSAAKARNVTAVKRFGVVGPLLDRLRESDSVISLDSDTSSQFVTKRKRIRKNRKKSKKNESEETPTPVTYDVKPMNVKACPRIHIKFDGAVGDEDQMDTLEEKPLIIGDGINETNTDNRTANKTEDEVKQQASDINENQSLVPDVMTLSDEDDDPIMENKSIFGEESISKAPLMTNKLVPKVGDVIAFKVFIMTQDYTPQVSNYIVGKLEMYPLDSKTVYFKILRGEEQLVAPSGKLSLNDEADIQPPRYRKFLWTELIEPKLLYP